MASRVLLVLGLLVAGSARANEPLAGSLPAALPASPAPAQSAESRAQPSGAPTQPAGAHAQPSGASAVPSEPIRIVESSVLVPADLDPEAALASVSDIARIFELYEPAIPWVPGVSIELTKEVVSDAGAECILELPVSGSAVGKDIVERARVTATSKPVNCGKNKGNVIVLSFHDSTWNIERRIDRIEITACLEAAGTGHQIRALGKMYAGVRPQDPALNPVAEAIGAKAIQGAFIRQVEPIVQALELHWRDLER